MAANAQSDKELNFPTDPAQLGADPAPETGPADDSRDMSTIMADAEAGRAKVGTTPAQDAESQQGSDFDQQRRQGAAGTENTQGTAGQGQGMGRSGTNGDEDRGYDQSGYRGGLGASGGREDLSDRDTDTNANPFTGGYDGGGDKQAPDKQGKNIGLDAAQPTGNGAADPEQ